MHTRAWVTLMTNDQYLPGVLALNFSLRQVRSQYPFIVLLVEAVSDHARSCLHGNAIQVRSVDYLKPKNHAGYTIDTRFNDSWTHLTAFSLYEYEKVVLLDADMLVLKNADELFEIHLDEDWIAAAHACVCNPLGKQHYPRDWIAANCAYTLQDPEHASHGGMPWSSGLKTLNGGLQVICPSRNTFEKIFQALHSKEAAHYPFAEQTLLSNLFQGRWVPLSYKYNALKTMRWCHRNVWRDNDVKIIHYILSPKPWEEEQASGVDATHTWWWRTENARQRSRLQAAEDQANGAA